MSKIIEKFNLTKAMVEDLKGDIEIALREAYRKGYEDGQKGDKND